jgi:hypothetical protein
MERKGRSHNGLAFVALNDFFTKIAEEQEINHRLHRCWLKYQLPVFSGIF